MPLQQVLLGQHQQRMQSKWRRLKFMSSPNSGSNFTAPARDLAAERPPQSLKFCLATHKSTLTATAAPLVIETFHLHIKLEA